MDAKLLTEQHWKITAAKAKVKDNGLQRALASYEQLEEEKHTERLKAIALIKLLATSLKRAMEAAKHQAMIKHLADVLSAAEAHRKEVEAAAAKACATTKRQEAQEKQKAKEDEDEDENGEEEEAEEGGVYAVKLVAAFQKLKSAKDAVFQFLVCDAKPHCAVMVAKKITPQHKEELSKVTGGSKRFLHLGNCQFEDGRFVFTMEKPVAGLAKKLQDSIRTFTGKKLPVRVGAESAEDDAVPPPGVKDVPLRGVDPALRGAPAAPKLGKASLEKAPEVWHQTRQVIEHHVDQLKTEIRKAFADEGPDLVAEIDENMKKLDWILDTLDHKLSDSLAKANAAQDAAARQAELKNSKAILANYIKYVKSEPMIAHIDSNPFGVKVNMKQLLTESLTHVAQAIA